jgi:hypothetical protein
MEPLQMTTEQWNGLVALMRAIAVEAATPGKLADGVGEKLAAKRQAGACETQVRRLFVAEESN